MKVRTIGKLMILLLLLSCTDNEKINKYIDINNISSYSFEASNVEMSFHNLSSIQYFDSLLYIPAFELHTIFVYDLLGKLKRKYKLPYEYGYPLFFELSEKGEGYVYFNKSSWIYSFKLNSAANIKVSEFIPLQNLSLPTSERGKFLHSNKSNFYFSGRKITEFGTEKCVYSYNIKEKVFYTYPIKNSNQQNLFFPKAEFPIVLNADDNYLSLVLGNEIYHQIIDLENKVLLKKKLPLNQDFVTPKGLSVEQFSSARSQKQYVVNNSIYLRAFQIQDYMYRAMKEPQNWKTKEGIITEYFEGPWQIERHNLKDKTLEIIKVAPKIYNSYSFKPISPTAFVLTNFCSVNKPENKNLIITVFSYE